MVEVPVEVCFAVFLQSGKQALLDFLQEVEADKEVVVVREALCVAGSGLVVHDGTCYLTVESTLVGKSLGA